VSLCNMVARPCRTRFGRWIALFFSCLRMREASPPVNTIFGLNPEALSCFAARSIAPQAAVKQPNAIASSVFLPNIPGAACGTRVLRVAGDILLVALRNDSSIIRIPGMIWPPKCRPARSSTSMVIAVPASMIQSAERNSLRAPIIAAHRSTPRRRGCRYAFVTPNALFSQRAKCTSMPQCRPITLDNFVANALPATLLAAACVAVRGNRVMRIANPLSCSCSCVTLPDLLIRPFAKYPHLRRVLPASNKSARISFIEVALPRRY